MQAKSIDISARLTHGGGTRIGTMSGYAYIDSGFLYGHFVPKQGCWTLKDRLLLTAFTFTGCPIAARTRNPELNPWRWTSGSYRAERRAKAPSFAVQSSIFARGEGDTIKMDLALDCTGAVPPLHAVNQPFQEEIREWGMGHLGGKFTMSFLDTDMNSVELEVVTDYFLDIGRSVKPAWRNITIAASDGPDMFTQFEQIDSFSSEPEALEDLRAKLAVLRQMPRKPPREAAGSNYVRSAGSFGR